MIKFLFFISFLTFNSFGVVGFTGNGFISSENIEVMECSAQSTSSIYVDCLTRTLPINSGYMVLVECSGIRSDNAEFGAVEKQVLISRASGTASIVGSVVTQFDQTGGAGWAMDLDVNSNDVRVRVKSPSEIVNWTCSIKMVKKI